MISSAASDASVETGVAGFLAAQMPGAREIVVSLSPRSVSGHSRQNQAFEAAWLEGSRRIRRRFILRRQSLGGAWDNPRAREFQLLQILKDQLAVPTPDVFWLDTSGTWLQRPFFVSEWCEGAANYRLFNDDTVPERQRLRLMRRHVEALAAIHLLDWERLGVPQWLAAHPDPHAPVTLSLRDPGGRQLELLRNRLEALGGRFERGRIVERALAWLDDAKPEPRRLCLVHGDFGPHNTLVCSTEISAVVDWEFADVSDPTQDLAWFTIRYRSVRDNFAQEFLSVEACTAMYRELTGFHVDPFELRWWQALGLCRTITGRGWFDAARTTEAAPARPLPEDESLLAALVTADEQAGDLAREARRR